MKSSKRPEEAAYKDWLKQTISSSPGNELDQAIMAMAHRKLSKNERLHKKNVFHFLGLTGALILILISVEHYSPSGNKKLAFNEPVEMIFYYKNIELMNEAAILSENDWNTIEGKTDEI